MLGINLLFMYASVLLFILGLATASTVGGVNIYEIYLVERGSTQHIALKSFKTGPDLLLPGQAQHVS